MAGELRREYSEAGGSRWYQELDSVEDATADYLVQRTQKEIAKAAWVSEEDFAADPANAGADMVDEREDNRGLMDQMELSEGADGRPLPMEEVIHRNLYGDTPGNDRPVELHNMEQAAEYIEQLEGELESEREVSHELISGGLPSDIDRHRQDAIMQADRALENSGMRDPSQRAQVIAHQENLVISNQLSNAAARYGDDFRTAYQALSALPDTPRNRQTARSVIYAGHAGGDAGEAVMNWYYGGQPRQASQQASRRQQQEPQHERRAPLTRRQQEDFEGATVNYYDRAQHDDIYDYAFSDRRRNYSE